MLETFLQDMYNEKESIKLCRDKYCQCYTPGISIIVPTIKLKYMHNIFKNYQRSSYPVKELIIILNNNELNLSRYEAFARRFRDVRVLRMDESVSLGECLNFGIISSRYDYISKMDDDDFYGPNYLTDLMHTLNSSECQVTGKNPVFVYFEENKSLYIFKSSKIVTGATLLFRKDIFPNVRFRDVNIGEDYYFLYDCARSGIKIEPSDKYNYVYIRHSNLQDHTFKITSEDFLEEGIYNIEKIMAVNNFSPIVTV